MTSPHVPHAHYDEELVIVLNGTLRLAYSSRPTQRVAPSDAGSRGEKQVASTSTSIVRDAPRGTIAVHSSQNNHTLAAIDRKPVSYFCLRMVGARLVEHVVTRHSPMEIQHGRLAHTHILSPSARLLSVWDAAERGTGHPPIKSGKREDMLDSMVLSGGERLHIHATLTPPGGGYAPHADAYDVILLILAGSIEMTGQAAQRLGPGSLALLPAGSTHGLRNAGNTTSVHYAFELRSPDTAVRE
jgi:quercetin dioxygenase-like cupin family protein